MARNIHIDSERDLIVAPATAAGRGAIAIVRLSGAGALAMGEGLTGAGLLATGPGRLHLATLRDPAGNAAIDQVLAAAWAAPRSYTGEDMVEFHLHGSPAVVQACLDACVTAGARPATPGEFTRRAFLNGKMDLAQAEAVAALSSSQTDAARRAALGQLRGGLSGHLMSIRRTLVQVAAELEASVDYPEEDIEPATRERLGDLVDGSVRSLEELRASYRRGRRLQEGARIVLAGPPNAGKSSLFNALLRRERAIVSPHAGTTRDTLEAVIDLMGIPLTLVDTAGLRHDAGEIETMGIDRSRQEIQAADLALFLVDASGAGPDARREYEALRDLPHLLVYTKADLVPGEDRRTAIGEHFPRGGHFVSVTTREGLDGLEQEVARRLFGASTEASEVTLTAARHERAVSAALDALHTVTEGLASGLSPEFVVVDLAEALSQLDTITGLRELDEDILDAVFTTFCLGK